MTEGHTKRFSADKAARLYRPERYDDQPPAFAVDALELAPDSVVLDHGAGPGFYTLPIAARLAELDGYGRVLASDVQPRMLELLRERAEHEGLALRIEEVVGDEETGHIPVGDDTVDRALLASVYHELPDRAASLAELRRVLGPDCMLLIVDWPVVEERVVGPPLDHRVPLETVFEELQAAGFVEIEAIDLYEPMYAVRAVSP